MSTILEADTLLAVDVGTVNTRVSLFDVVDGRYRMVATGRASSTAGAPVFDVREGMHVALDEVSEITGRPFFDESDALVMPTTNSGAGVDAFVSTASAGPHVRTVLVGLMPGRLNGKRSSPGELDLPECSGRDWLDGWKAGSRAVRRNARC